MDKKIEHSSRKNIIRGIAVFAIAVVICSGYIFQHESSMTVDRSNVTTSMVKHVDFQEIISFSAFTEPVNSVDISIVEGGKVMHIAVQNGDSVRKGDVLVTLENPDLRLEFMNKETQIIEQINHLRNARILLESEQKSDEEALIDLQYQLDQMARKFTTDTLLYSVAVIAENDFRETELKQDYYMKKMYFLSSNFNKNKRYRMEQLQQIDASIALMQRNLKAITAHLQNLTITSPFEGILTNFNLNLGESLQKNQTIGRVEAPKDYKAIASIDEHYIHAVREGQEGTFKLNGKTETFTLSKIYPTVVNSTFQADVIFSSELSSQMTKGQTLHLKLPISENRKALVVEKGEFYPSSSGSWVYVVEGNTAVRKEITIGKQNDQYYEVISGLSEHDIIINSSYTSFEEVEELHLN